MKKIISFKIDGSNSTWNIEYITKALKNKFSFPIKSTTINTAQPEDGMARYKYRCEISAECNEEQKELLIREVRGYASHAELM